MSESIFKTIILAIPNINDALVGGVYTSQELGSRGLVSNNPACAAAWTSTHGMPTLLPCLVIRVRNDTSDYERVDHLTRETSTLGQVGLWFYQQAGYALIEAAAQMVYNALQLRSFAGIGLVRHAQQQSGLNAPEWDNVSLHIDNYTYKRVKRTV